MLISKYLVFVFQWKETLILCAMNIQVYNPLFFSYSVHGSVNTSVRNWWKAKRRLKTLFIKNELNNCGTLKIEINRWVKELLTFLIDGTIFVTSKCHYDRELWRSAAQKVS